MADVTKGARHLVRFALAFGFLAPALVLFGALGTNFGLLDWKFGFGTVAVDWAPKAAMAGIAVGLAAVLFSFADFRKLGVLAVAALLVPAATLYGFHSFKKKAQSLPPIHDVSTNWDEPPMFSEAFMRQERKDAVNPVERDPRAPVREGSSWSGKRVADLNAEYCPGARPVPRLVDAAEVREVLEDQGMTIFGEAPWRVEAYSRSAWFGFVDDVIVIMRPGRTDVRSISRVGVSDVGANCERVTRIVEALGG